MTHETPFAAWEARQLFTSPRETAAALGVYPQHIHRLRKRTTPPGGPLARSMELLDENRDLRRRVADLEALVADLRRTKRA